MIGLQPNQADALHSHAVLKLLKQSVAQLIAAWHCYRHNCTMYTESCLRGASLTLDMAGISQLCLLVPAFSAAQIWLRYSHIDVHQVLAMLAKKRQYYQLELRTVHKGCFIENKTLYHRSRLIGCSIDPPEFAAF